MVSRNYSLLRQLEFLYPLVIIFIGLALSVGFLLPTHALAAEIEKACNPLSISNCYINNGSPIGGSNNDLFAYRGIYPDDSINAYTAGYQSSNTNFSAPGNNESPLHVGGYWWKFVNAQGSGNDWIFQLYFDGTVWYDDLPTCNDGIQNQDETGIDRGGVCTQTISSDIITNTTWGGGVLYVVSDDIEITTGNTLTIEPGTRIQFDDTIPSSLTVNGTLDAIGLVDAKIIFTSNATTQAPGDWGGITVGSTGEANFEYALVKYGGATGGNEANIYNDGGSVSFVNSEASYSEHCGIKNDSGITTIEDGSDVGFNDAGVCKTGGTISITDSIIHDNSSFGVYNATMAVVNAENNYWGDITGPDGYGPGSGDSVSDYVDYDPWTPYLDFPNEDGDSVNMGKIQYDVSTTYTTEFNSAVSAWNGLGNISIEPVTTTADLTIEEDNYGDTAWAGQWVPTGNPDTIYLNSHFLDGYSSALKQNVITHELGHALGLGHSFVGNIMYFMATTQTALGDQDRFDYYLLWP